ncbi:alpha-L-rhamnosidase N-terminal domain-containing protein [candidate division KSB1 bacterium]|nr:alpha-L-rhamnosidase N-terminal domain-containing protein [candidate division KSB1 bacterium]
MLIGCLMLGFTNLSHANINPDLMHKKWPARWIAPADVSLNDYGVYHFRRTFHLSAKPRVFIVHVSADNRYELFVNGERVSTGPARSDLTHWNFETVDIAAYLKAGKNVIAAQVWNWGADTPVAQFSYQTAFILQANSESEAILNTDDQWKVIRDDAYQPIPSSEFNLHQYYVAGPGDRIDGNKYPWGWTAPDFDDSGWQKPRLLEQGASWGAPDAGTQHVLVPRPIPQMESSRQRIRQIAKQYGVKADQKWLDGKKALTIPANTTAVLLLDQTYLTTIYPEILINGGKGSYIKLTYAEALFDKNNEKGNRDQVDGKSLRGNYDMFLPDGGKDRLFRPLWWRTFRYILLEIRTQGDALTINDFSGVFTAYPFAEQASFKSNDPVLGQIWNVGWRTARLCANETFMDCPYYEQLQYVGDTRIQALVSLYVSGDDRLMRNAISQFNNSRMPDGLTMSRYPSQLPQVIPPYSLFWIAMIHDYWMLRNDPAFVESFLAGIQGVLDWHAQFIDDTGMLKGIPWWNFVDWPDQWRWNSQRAIGGVPDGVENSYSSILALQYAYVLNMGADLFMAFHEQPLAEYYRQLAESVAQATYRLCWDGSRELMADTPLKTSFSQHANVLAVLDNVIPKQSQAEFIRRVADDASLIQCTVYYRFYLFQAFKKAGLGNEYIERLQPWRTMLNMGLTTFAERPEPTRSDCHAWSASPVYDLLATVIGIEPEKPGFKTVKIEPRLGPLRWAEATFPHPAGDIKIKLKRRNADGIDAEITMPANLTGVFIWNGKSQSLAPGFQALEW